MTIEDALSVLERSKHVIPSDVEIYFIDEKGEYFGVTGWEITEDGVSFKI